MNYLLELPREAKCYLVFKGTPSVFYITEDNNTDALDAAQDLARSKTEKTGESHTVMCVPRDSLEVALTAVSHGIKFHRMQSVDSEDEEW